MTRARFHRIPLRARISMWVVGMVVVTGAALSTITLTVTSHLLRSRNVAENQTSQPAPGSAAGQQPGNQAGFPPGVMPGGQPPLGAPNDPAAPGTAPGTETPANPDSSFRQTARAAAESTFSDMRLVSTATVIALALLAVGLAWWVAGWMLRPLTEMAAVVRRVTGDGSGHRIGWSGPADEMGALANTVDTMLDRIDTTFVNQRRFVSNASHELRTPLTLIKATADIALDDPDATTDELRQALSDVSASVERSNALVESLLTLSKAGTLTTFEECDLTEIAHDVACRFSPATGSAERGESVQIAVKGEPLLVSGDPRLLQRMVENLVENAIAYRRAGSAIAIDTAHVHGERPSIHAHDIAHGEAVVNGPKFDDGAQNPQKAQNAQNTQQMGARLMQLTVTNECDPLQTVNPNVLFDRFVRDDRARARRDGGVGLGLSIVREIAEAHGGTVSASCPTPTRFQIVVTLPTITT